MLNEPKVAQMAAFFLKKDQGSMPVLKLIKLLYLADRRSLQLYAAPMSGDRMVSMPHGPVLSQTYEFINGFIQSSDGGWSLWILPRADYKVQVNPSQADKALDELSLADQEILEAVWQQFGKMNQWQIRDYTHDKCPEWEDPRGSSKPIPYNRLFETFGKTHHEAKRLSAALEAENFVEQTFARL